MFDLLVTVVQGLIRAPFILACGRQLKAVDGRRRQVPEPDAFSLRGKGTGQSQQRQANRDQLAWHVASEERSALSCSNSPANINFPTATLSIPGADRISVTAFLASSMG